MSWLEAVASAWRALLAHKSRSLLTMLGIIIGVSAVIAMISVGEGVSATVTEQFEGLGSHLIVITPARGINLSLDHVSELLARVPSLDTAAPVLSFQATLKQATTTVDAQVEGTNEAYPLVRSHTVASGRFITPSDVAARTRVAVLGAVIASDLFGRSDPVGQRISVDGHVFEVVGVMALKGSSLGQNPDEAVLVPITTAQRIRQTNRIAGIQARAGSAAEAKLAVSHLQAVFSHLFRQDDPVRVLSQDEILAAVDTTTGILTLMLAALAGISLLVGGVGIMNIMLVSVAERTREIGVRKALGATRRDVMLQFLIEAILLSTAGGAIGAFLGGWGATTLAGAAGWKVIVSQRSVMVAVGFASTVGLFFGLYPAYRASALDPIEALRYQ